MGKSTHIIHTHKMSQGITSVMDSGMGTTTENSGAPGWSLETKKVKKTKKKKSTKKPELDPELDLKTKKSKNKELKDKALKNPYNSIVTEKQFYTVCEPCNFSYDFMLQRLHDNLQTKKPAEQQIAVPAPKMVKIG